MKTIIFTFVIIAIIANCQSEEHDEKEKAVKKACANEWNISEETIELIHSKDFVFPKNPSEDLKCFAKCVLAKGGVLDEHDNLDEEKALEKTLKHVTDRVKAQGIVEACRDETGEDGCEKAYNIFECYFLHKRAALAS